MRLRDLLNGAEFEGMSVRGKAFQAWQTLNEMQEAAVSGLLVPEEAASFREAFRLPDFRQLVAEFEADGYTGKALYSKLFDKLCSKTCFVAGTLIWTDKGLVPIEQIQIGDLVLSKPETNDGPQAYKRVVKTFYFDDQEVEFVEVARGHRGMGPGFGCTAIVVTGDHPVWAKNGDEAEWRWQPINPVGSTSQLELQDGGICDVIVNESILQCKTEEGPPIVGLGFARPKCSNYGQTIDFRYGTPVCQLSDSGVITEDYDVGDPCDRYLARVYNFTVEDYHTYYVGEWGIWVHNANYLELGAARVARMK